MPTREDGITLAAHRGQVYPSPAGEPFILHALRVMLRLESQFERIVAVLHDIAEDTSCTIADLHEAGYQGCVLAAIEHLTHREDEAYDDYIERVAQNPIARRVKLADLSDKLANNRRLNLFKPGPDTRERIMRYVRAQKRLMIAGAIP
ncbi:MAG: GTP pyrophosphokinase [Ktedonobacterales bacterium]